jgi:hypothetical protein
MYTSGVLLCVLAATVANGLVLPSKDKQQLIEKTVDKATSYSYGVDISVAVSSYSFGRLSSNGYGTAFVRVYSSTGNGQVDPNAQSNLQNAHSQHVGTEVYVQPSANSYKSGSQQFNEAYQALQSYGITVNAIWLKVTSPIEWSSNQQNNINFINSFVSQAQSYGVTPGIFTSWYDWKQITSGYTGLQGSGTVRLWYWNTLGDGAYAETDPNFNDFRAFGGWSSAVVKQYGQSETKSGVSVAVNVFPTSNFAVNPQRSAAAPESDKDSTKIVVGNVFA